MVTLRNYQARAVEEIRGCFASGLHAPLLVSPTGSGKTIAFSFIAQHAAAKGNRVFILSHRQEIIRQICQSLERFNVPHGVIASGNNSAAYQMTQVASVQTLVRRLDRIQAPDLLIIDEAHHSASKTYRDIIAKWPNAKRLGVTATPQRLDGRGLGDVFDKIVLGPPVQQLIDEGFLSRPVYYAPPMRFDPTKLHIVGGDYNKAEVEAAIDVPTITGDAVDHYSRICPGKPAIVFCASLKHCQHTVDAFSLKGYRAEMIDGKMDDKTRADRTASLADGRIQLLVSCELLGEGYDVPVVSAAILLRPTASLSLCLQQIGRALRASPGKECAFIIDHVGNVLRHGLAEEPREWTLDAAVRKKRATPSSIANKQCPSCYAVFAPKPSCPQCGYVFPVQSREIEQVDGQLIQLTAEEIKLRRAKDARIEVGQAVTREELMALQKRRGHAPGWVDFILRSRRQKEFLRMRSTQNPNQQKII